MVESQTDHANVKIKPPVLLLIHVIAVILLRWLLPLPSLSAFPKTLEWLGYILVILGIGLGAGAVSRFRRAHTTTDPHGPVLTIVTTGPYHFTRNPIYLGLVCMLIGFSFAFRTYWGLILSPLFIVLMNTLVIQYEEAYLEKKFGEVYTDYKSHVRRWL